VYICSEITERGLFRKDRILKNCYQWGQLINEINLEDRDYLNPDSFQFKGDASVKSSHCYLSGKGDIEIYDNLE